MNLADSQILQDLYAPILPAKRSLSNPLRRPNQTADSACTPIAKCHRLGIFQPRYVLLPVLDQPGNRDRKRLFGRVSPLASIPKFKDPSWNGYFISFGRPEALLRMRFLAPLRPVVTLLLLLPNHRGCARRFDLIPS